MKQNADPEKHYGVKPRTWTTMHGRLVDAVVIAPPCYTFVIDLNLLLSAILHKAKCIKRTTRFEQLVADGLVEFWAPHWLLSELLSSSALDDFLNSRRQPCTRMEMLEAWDILRSYIKIDHTLDYPLKQYLGYSEDLKDEPYATLARKLPGAKLLSTDKGFDRLVHDVYGHETLGHLDRVSCALDTQATSAVITIIAPTYSLAGVGYGITKGLQAVPKAPPWVQASLALATVGLAASLIHPTSRNKAISVLQTCWTGLKPLRDAYSKTYKDGERAKSEVEFLINRIEESALTQSFGVEPATS